MTTTVLAFGHLPKFHGGRQQSGLANAMWAIATNMADSDTSFSVAFCATDVFAKSIRSGGLTVLGWTKTALLAGMLRAPLRSFGLVGRMIGPCWKYRLPLLRTALRALHLQQALARIEPDYLHLHGCESVALLDAGVFDPANTIVTIHGMFGKAGPQNLCEMEQALNRQPLRLLAFVSSKIGKEWRETFGRPAPHVEVIPNAFDRQAFFLAKGEAKQKGGVKGIYRLVTVGSVCDRKGQNRVVEAILRLKSSGAPYEVDFTMIGSSVPEEDAGDLVRQAANAGVAVHHIPYLSPSELRDQLRLADFMILPASNEGFGLVFLESIACGVPVVLPKELPICDEPDLISAANAVLLESASADAVFTFLASLPEHSFLDTTVAGSLPDGSWQDVGARYRSLLAGPFKG